MPALKYLNASSSNLKWTTLASALANISNGAYTLAWVVKRSGGGGGGFRAPGYMLSGSGAGTTLAGFSFNATDLAYMDIGAGVTYAGTANTSTDVFLYVLSKAAGSATPRLGIQNLTAGTNMTHVPGGGPLTDQGVATMLQLGSWANSDFFDGWQGLFGAWAGAMSDANKALLGTNKRTSDLWTSAHGTPLALVEQNTLTPVDLAGNLSVLTVTGLTLDAAETLAGWNFDGTGVPPVIPPNGGTNTAIVVGSIARATRRGMPSGQMRGGGIVGGQVARGGVRASRLYTRMVIPSAPAGGVTLSGAAADSTTTSDVASALKTTSRAAADAAAATDVANGLKTTSRGAADSTSTSDAALAIKAGARGASDTAPGSDAAGGLKTTARAAADATSTSDVALGLKTTSRGAADSTSVSDGAGATLVRTRAGSAADSTSVTDATGALKATNRAAGDSAPASDATGRSVSVTRGAGDATSVSTAAGAIKAGARGASDSAPATDTAGGSRSVSRAVGDATVTSDTANGVKAGARSGADVAGAADVASGVHAGVRGAADAAAASDAAGALKAGVRGAADAAGVSDAATRKVNVAKVVGDVTSLSDAAAGVKIPVGGGFFGSAADSAGVSDAAGGLRWGQRRVMDYALPPSTFSALVQSTVNGGLGPWSSGGPQGNSPVRVAGTGIEPWMLRATSLAAGTFGSWPITPLGSVLPGDTVTAVVHFVTVPAGGKVWFSLDFKMEDNTFVSAVALAQQTAPGEYRLQATAPAKSSRITFAVYGNAAGAGDVMEADRFLLTKGAYSGPFFETMSPSLDSVGVAVNMHRGAADSAPAGDAGVGVRAVTRFAADATSVADQAKAVKAVSRTVSDRLVWSNVVTNGDAVGGLTGTGANGGGSVALEVASPIEGSQSFKVNANGAVNDGGVWIGPNPLSNFVLSARGVQVTAFALVRGPVGQRVVIAVSERDPVTGAPITDVSGAGGVAGGVLTLDGTTQLLWLTVTMAATTDQVRVKLYTPDATAFSFTADMVGLTEGAWTGQPFMGSMSRTQDAAGATHAGLRSAVDYLTPPGSRENLLSNPSGGPPLGVNGWAQWVGSSANTAAASIAAVADPPVAEVAGSVEFSVPSMPITTGWEQHVDPGHAPWVRAGDTVHLRVWVRSMDGAPVGRLYLRGFGDAGGFMSNTITTHPSTTFTQGNWIECAGTVVVPAGVTRAVPEIILTGGLTLGLPYRMRLGAALMVVGGAMPSAFFLGISPGPDGAAAVRQVSRGVADVAAAVDTAQAARAVARAVLEALPPLTDTAAAFKRKIVSVVVFDTVGGADLASAFWWRMMPLIDGPLSADLVRELLAHAGGLSAELVGGGGAAAAVPGARSATLVRDG